MLIVFDLDGTLVDSQHDLAESANALLAEYGAPPLSEDTIGNMVGDGAPMLVQRACMAAGLPSVPVDALSRFLALYDGRLLNHTRPYAGTREMLERFAATCTLAVLTNKPGEASKRILEGTGLFRFFKRIVAGDGPWPRKPEPSGLQWLMGEAGEQPGSTVLVGDSIVDLRTARAAGVPFCLARYGFGNKSVSGFELTTDDQIIGQPSELTRLFLKPA